MENLSKGNKYFVKAKQLLKSGKWIQAKKYFQTASSFHFSPSLSHVYIGHIQLLNYEVSDAFKTFQMILSNNSNEGEVYYYIGKIYKIFDNRQESISYFKKTLFLSKNENLRLLAYEEIEEYLEENEKYFFKKQAYNAYLIRTDISEDEEFLREGIIARIENDFEKAVEIFNKTIFSYPEYYAPYYELAKTYLKNQQYHQAYQILKKITQIFKHEKFVYYELAKTCFFVRRHKESIKYAKKLIRLIPKNSKIYFNLGVNLTLIGKYTEAVKYYKKSIELNPKFFDAYYNTGFIYQKNGFLEEALDYYKQALLLEPESPELNYNLGMIYFEAENYFQSLYHFMKSYQIDENMKEALNNFEVIRNYKTIENSTIRVFEFTLPTKISLAMTLMMLIITFIYFLRV
ncbi:MAG: hypothetical protein A2Y41_12440 [Spirochaetes bacterium GWB1_36_13]|nr:MAG: hypothetical protein A2Y41_12440 [Spirochaetes bacterium GWB1_36_13]